MSEPIYPGATWDPGVAAGHTRGRNRMEVVKLHYTVGRNSTGIGKQGYFQFLQHRDGSLSQFAEVDALCYDSGNFNDEGPGVEIEYHPSYHDIIVTEPAWASLKRLFEWLHDEWGMPLTYFDVETLPERVKTIPAGVGFISHRSLDQAPDNHTDYMPREDWDLMWVTVPELPKDDDMPWIARTETGSYLVEAGWRRGPVPDVSPYEAEGWPVRTGYDEWWDNGQMFAPATSGGSGASADEVVDLFAQRLGS